MVLSVDGLINIYTDLIINYLFINI